jgi:hypothetical protein
MSLSAASVVAQAENCQENSLGRNRIYCPAEDKEEGEGEHNGNEDK